MIIRCTASKGTRTSTNLMNFKSSLASFAPLKGILNSHALSYTLCLSLNTSLIATSLKKNRTQTKERDPLIEYSFPNNPRYPTLSTTSRFISRRKIKAQYQVSASSRKVRSLFFSNLSLLKMKIFRTMSTLAKRNSSTSKQLPNSSIAFLKTLRRVSEIR